MAAHRLLFGRTMRLAILALTAATSVCFVEGCMLGCDAGGIDDKHVTMDAQKLEASTSCGKEPTFHLRAEDEKGNSITFDLARQSFEGDEVVLSVESPAAGASEQVTRSSDGSGRMAIRMASGADAVDTTEIISAAVEIVSLPARGTPFSIRVRIGFADGATLDEAYTVVATPDPTCQVPG
jgi:hypothetical protein